MMPTFQLKLSGPQAKILTDRAKSATLDPESYIKALVIDSLSPRSVTIKDIAAKLKVAPMTVSYALNNIIGTNGVSEETRDRVLAMAKKMGYRPNLSARSFRKKRS